MRKQTTRLHRLLSDQVALSWWRRLSVALIISISLPALSLAQTKIWDKTIGGNKGDALTEVLQTKDGGYLLGGYSYSGKGGDKTHANKSQSQTPTPDFWVVKLNADGSKAWDKTLGGNDYDYLYSMQQTSDGGYLLGGYSQSGPNGDKSEAGRGIDGDYWVVKLKADGTKIWDKTFGGDKEDQLAKVIQTQDGGYLLGGYSGSDISGDKTAAKKGGSDFWIVKLRANGTKVWDKTFGGTNEDMLTSLMQTEDGSYLLGGSSRSGISGDKSEANRGVLDYWVVKLKADGSKVWDKTLGGTAEEHLTSFQATSDGGFIVAGSSESDNSGDKTGKRRDTEYDFDLVFPSDYWVVKLNANGSKIWDKTIGGNKYDGLSAVLQTKDGDILLGGYSLSDVSGEKTESNIGSTDYWLVKLKKDGSQAWDKTLGGTNIDNLTAVQQISNGSYILGGYSYSDVSKDKSEPRIGQTDYWIVKLAEKTAQTITFAPIAGKTYGDAPFTLSAKASSGLPVTFRVVSGPATIKGNTITLTGPGKVTVKASQAGNATYAPAETMQSFTVQAAALAKLQWDKTIGGNSYDKLSISLQTSDGGYILGGTSSSGISGDKSEASRDKVEGWGLGDYWVVKLKADGTKEWDRTFGGNIEDQLRSVQQTSDGGYILGGTSSSGKGGDKSEANKGGVTDRGAPTTDYWVVKLDAIGNKLWDKTIGGNYFDELQSIQQTSDGGYILGGFSHSDIGGDKTEPNEGGLDIFGHPSPDYWVVKIDANGHKLWDKTFGGNDSDHLTSLQQTHDGGYILGGYSYSDAGGDKSEANKGEAFTGDYWIIKLKPDGAKVWDKTLGGDRDDRLVTVRQTPDGGYILGGTTTSSKSGDVSEDFTGVSDMDTGNYWVVKVDAHGNKIWDNKIGGVYEDNLTELQETKDGGYILGGTSQSVEGIDKTEGSLDNIYRGDYWIVKLNANGAKVWDKTLGSNVEDVLTSLQQTPDGTYLLGGYSNGGKSGDKSEENKGEKDESGNYTEDYWIVKLEDPDMQASAWDMRYGGSGIDNLSDVIKTSDGGYLAGGYSDSGVSGEKTQSSRGKNDYWIVKSDKNGKKLWDKRFGGSDHDYLNRVIQTQDGGYLLAGSSFSGISGDKTEESRGTISAHYGQRDYWVVKVDKAGNKQWDKRFGGSQTDELVKVVQLATGEYVLGGYSDSPAEGDKSQGYQGPYQNTDYWLVKISATGQKIWDKRYGGINDEKLGGFTVTADGGFLLAGTSASGNTGDKSQAKRGLTDYWVVRTDKDGKLLWEKAYGGSKVEEAYSVVPGPGHTFFISGTSTSAANGSKSEPSRGGRDYWVLKIDASGRKLWDKTLGSATEDLLQASAITREGGVVLAGTSYVGTSGEKSQYGSGDYDYWVVQLDAEGNKVRDLTLGGSAQEVVRTITQTRDGGLLVGGRSKSGVSGDRTQPSQGGTDYWLVKVAPETNATVAAREASIMEAATPQNDLQVQAYPNPFSDRATIRFTLPETQQASVKVYDGQGNEVATLFNGEAKAKQNYQVEWKAGNKPASLYFLQLQTSTKKHQQKLLLTK